MRVEAANLTLLGAECVKRIAALMLSYPDSKPHRKRCCAPTLPSAI